MGTPDFAVPTLQKLIDSDYEITSVFTQPDKPKGRGHKMQFSPVKELAIANNLEVFQPNTLKDEAVINSIREQCPDFIVVAAYGKILPEAILNIPPYGCINVHGSLLPKYRGAAPIQWSVLNGDKATGVTTMYMGKGLDTGDMLLKTEVEIGANETAGELFDRLAPIGADLLMETLEALVNKTVTPEKQDDSKSNYASIITKALSPIDWNKSATEIHNQVRGLNPWPCASSHFGEKGIKIHRTEVLNMSGKAGKLFMNGNHLCIYCGDGALQLVEVQLENGKRMSGDVFVNGHPIKDDSYLN